MNTLRNALILTLALVLASCNTSHSNSSPDEPPPLAGSSIGGPFQLIDQNGKQVSDRSFAGKYRIMYFGYTYCPDVCPMDAQAIGAGMKLLERRDPGKAAKVVPIFVTVDPLRDTPAVLKQFVSAFSPKMVGLTGSVDAINRTAKEFAVFHQKGATTSAGGYLVNHSRQTYLMDPDNQPIALVPSDEGSKAVADTLERWVR